MKNQKYPDGYLPKISYHIAQGSAEKVQYFLDRQVQQYGPITSENLDVILQHLKA